MLLIESRDVFSSLVVASSDLLLLSFERSLLRMTSGVGSFDSSWVLVGVGCLMMELVLWTGDST